jgi:hypothetical protein
MCCSLPAASHIVPHSALADFSCHQQEQTCRRRRRWAAYMSGAWAPQSCPHVSAESHHTCSTAHTLPPLVQDWCTSLQRLTSIPGLQSQSRQELAVLHNKPLKAGESPAGRPWERVLQQHCHRQHVVLSSRQHLQRNILKKQGTCLPASLGKGSCSSTAMGSICCSPFHSRRSSSPTGCHQQFATSSWPTITPACRHGMAGIRCPCRAL